MTRTRGVHPGRPGPRTRGARFGRPATRSRALLPAVAALAFLTACTAAAEPGKPETPSPFADCATLTAAASPAAASPAAASPATGAPGHTRLAVDLPDLTLPCFTGGAPIALRDVPGPAVINLWASWCEPCRTELPVMQGLADRAQGRLTVLGVSSRDPREAAASFAADNGVRFPMLVDSDYDLAVAIKQPALPATIFIGPDGAVAIHRRPLDVDELIEKVREHTGVTVTR